VSRKLLFRDGQYVAVKSNAFTTCLSDSPQEVGVFELSKRMLTLVATMVL